MPRHVYEPQGVTRVQFPVKIDADRKIGAKVFAYGLENANPGFEIFAGDRPIPAFASKRIQVELRRSAIIMSVRKG